MPQPTQEPVFKTPLAFTIPSFLLGASMSLDMGATLRTRTFREYLTGDAEEADRMALLSDFVVVGDDLWDAYQATMESATPESDASESAA